MQGKDSKSWRSFQSTKVFLVPGAIAGWELREHGAVADELVWLIGQ